MLMYGPQLKENPQLLLQHHSDPSLRNSAIARLEYSENKTCLKTARMNIIYVACLLDTLYPTQYTYLISSDGSANISEVISTNT